MRMSLKEEPFANGKCTENDVFNRPQILLYLVGVYQSHVESKYVGPMMEVFFYASTFAQMAKDRSTRVCNLVG